MSKTPTGSQDIEKAAVQAQPDPNTSENAVRIGDRLYVPYGELVVVGINDQRVKVECPKGWRLENSRLVAHTPDPFDDGPATAVLSMAQAEALKARGR